MQFHNFTAKNCRNQETLFVYLTSSHIYFMISQWDFQFILCNHIKKAAATFAAQARPIKSLLVDQDVANEYCQYKEHSDDNIMNTGLGLGLGLVLQFAPVVITLLVLKNILVFWHSQKISSAFQAVLLYTNVDWTRQHTITSTNCRSQNSFML